MISDWTAVGERLLSNESTDVWFAVNVKTCPGCQKRIWKDGGCMHITCKPAEGGCGQEFCWLCLGLWSTHGSATGGNYACNNYTKAAGEGKLVGEAKQVATAII